MAVLTIFNIARTDNYIYISRSKKNILKQITFDRF